MRLLASGRLLIDRSTGSVCTTCTQPARSVTTVARAQRSHSHNAPTGTILSQSQRSHRHDTHRHNTHSHRHNTLSQNTLCLTQSQHSHRHNTLAVTTLSQSQHNTLTSTTLSQAQHSHRTLSRVQHCHSVTVTTLSVSQPSQSHAKHSLGGKTDRQ